MPGTVNSVYSCACLNVRITPVPQISDPPTVAAATPDFDQVHVADEGIFVAHPQVTLRIRTRGELTSRHRRARYTSLTCLLCQVLVYRVHQVISLDSDVREGPLMPTEEWVEQDILKSSSGWIEVHKACLTGDAITRVQKSPNYSPLFSVAIPMSSSPPASPQPTVEDAPQISYLAHLPPLFLPPPFTPAHPVFVHLVSLAQAQSEVLRADVEKYMQEVMRSKSAELAHTEAVLKRQVEAVWRNFRAGVQSVEEHLDTTGTFLPSPRSPRSPASRSASGTPASPATPAAAVIRDFVPSPVPPAARQSRLAGGISSLSASLATSGFHHPRARQQEQEESSEPPTSPRPASISASTSSRTLSAAASSPTLGGSPPRAQSQPSMPVVFEGGASVLQFRRTADPDINTAASYRFFRTLEEDMARSKSRREGEQQQSKDKEKDADEKQGAAAAVAPSSSAAGAAESSRAGPSTVNGKGKKHAHKNGSVGASAAATGSGEGEGYSSESVKAKVEAPTGESTNLKDKGKGKRKVVTFESQPAIVTIKREVNAEKEEEARLARDIGEEMIFELEAEGTQTDAESAEPAQLLMLLEQPTAQPRQTRRRAPKVPTNSTGLPQSFSALRPASLPVPSNIVPVRRPSQRRPTPGNDDTNTRIREEEAGAEGGGQVPVEEEYDSRDVEILKLVAANNPSHRGAWKKNSAEWNSLVRGEPAEDDQYEDDGEDGCAAPRPNGSALAGMPSSMPIAIRPLAKAQPLSLASYRPENMPPPPQEAAEPEPPVAATSSSVRKAIHAERDRERSMDPGALDFASGGIEEEDEEDEDEETENNHPSSVVPQQNVRGGQKRALKILQARSDLPDSGMWRSLVT